MKQMFDQRPNRLTLRKDFEKRTWQTSESFADYCHEKVILAGQVPIDEDEIIDYVIDGVPDPRLRDQARLHWFAEVSELLKAFENITLQNNPKTERIPFKKNQQKTTKEDRIATTETSPEMANSTQKKTFKCFNCKEPGHRASNCKKPREAEKSTGDRPNSSTEGSSATEANLVQPIVGSNPYTVSVEYAAP
ncbi:unnamed protein product [Lasius platythorax]|uniref:CCHC-type domain-containing protein n=1 Tax=Lasius platythorax TaxID=488582 RepID=A0AAV2NXS1_9HYME